MLFPRGRRLALMLLHEQRQGDASRVAGYVQQLLRTFDTPLHWNPAEREALQYPHLVNEVGPPTVPHVQTHVAAAGFKTLRPEGLMQAARWCGYLNKADLQTRQLIERGAANA
jgi:hypothetical protein